MDGAKILRETWDGNTLVPLYDNEDSVCGIVYNNTPYYFQKNLQGDVIGIADEDGTVVAEYMYDAWGKVIDISGCDACIAQINPFRYRSYYFDECLQLYYLQSRYYDPEIGRFLNGDIGEIMLSLDRKPTNYNLLLYSANNPVNNSDHTGYVVSPANIIGAVIGGIVGAVGGYFLTQFLADKLGLRGWKRTVFIWGLTAVITAAAATIGYFIGPYVAKAAKAVFKGLKKILVDNLKRSGCCFVAGTLIKTANGSIPIEKIAVGDLVYSCNPLTKEYGYQKVSRVFQRETDTIVRILIQTERIETTLDHPFWVIDKGWTNSQCLVEGDKVLLDNGEYAVVEEVEIEKLDALKKVYNFEVEKWHSYYISKYAILVHNANCGNELQQLREAARKMGIKDQNQYRKLSNYLHKWKKKHGMKPSDHLPWDDLVDLIFEFLGK